MRRVAVLVSVADGVRRAAAICQASAVPVLLVVIKLRGVSACCGGDAETTGGWG